MSTYQQYREEIRLLIIEEKTLKSKDKLIQKIIKKKFKINIPQSTIQTIYKKYKEKGLISKIKPPGRPCNLTTRS